MPTDILSIRQYCCYHLTSLETVSIPENITSIGIEAFSGCTGIVGIFLIGKNSSSLKTIDKGAFSGCTSLSDIKLQSSKLETLSKNAFEGCTMLAEVFLPDSVIKIDDECFKDCIALTDIYYAGTQADWQQITIGTDAIPQGVTVHYEYS